jgi:hypothetical protein
MAGPGGEVAAAAADRGHLRQWKCYLGRHDYVQDRWDRPQGRPASHDGNVRALRQKARSSRLEAGCPLGWRSLEASIRQTRC